MFLYIFLQVIHISQSFLTSEKLQTANMKEEDRKNAQNYLYCSELFKTVKATRYF